MKVCSEGFSCVLSSKVNENIVLFVRIVRGVVLVKGRVIGHSFFSFIEFQFMMYKKT